jgi:hypothetical protein
LNTSKFYFKDLEVEHIAKLTLKNYTISLKVKDDTPYIIVKTPRFTSKVFIIELLHEKECWIRKNLLKLTQQTQLKLSEDVDRVKAENYLSQRVEYFSKIMQLSYSKLQFKNLKSRWGSCDSKRIITLNYQLLKVEKELIDYVVVHELAHLQEMNHSKRFHMIVDNYIVDAKQKRKQLKTNYTLVN